MLNDQGTTGVSALSSQACAGVGTEAVGCAGKAILDASGAASSAPGGDDEAFPRRPTFSGRLRVRGCHTGTPLVVFVEDHNKIAAGCPLKLRFQGTRWEAEHKVPWPWKDQDLSRTSQDCTMVLEGLESEQSGQIGPALARRTGEVQAPGSMIMERRSSGRCVPG